MKLKLVSGFVLSLGLLAISPVSAYELTGNDARATFMNAPEDTVTANTAEKGLGPGSRREWRNDASGKKFNCFVPARDDSKAYCNIDDAPTHKTVTALGRRSGNEAIALFDSAPQDVAIANQNLGSLKKWTDLKKRISIYCYVPIRPRLRDESYCDVSPMGGTNIGTEGEGAL